MTAAFLFAQLENHDDIQSRRRQSGITIPDNWETLIPEGFKTHFIPGYATINATYVFIGLQWHLSQRTLLINA
jgi:hypothetical protein